ncbi:fibronectin type III-like domain-contianing protein [bacterium]|nr:fibronectin type III-like domain-contianing protein [bacterium]
MNPEEKALISVDVTNIGKLPGDEVVQLYVQDEISSVTRPIIELKGFKKISLVPGEKRNVAFEIGPEELGLFDREMNFIVEPGSFKIMVGPNQQDVLVAVLDVTS